MVKLCVRGELIQGVCLRDRKEASIYNKGCEGVNRNDLYYDCCGTVIRNLLAQQRRKHVVRKQLSFQ